MNTFHEEVGLQWYAWIGVAAGAAYCIYVWLVPFGGDVIGVSPLAVLALTATVMRFARHVVDVGDDAVAVRRGYFLPARRVAKTDIVRVESVRFGFFCHGHGVSGL